MSRSSTARISLSESLSIHLRTVKTHDPPHPHLAHLVCHPGSGEAVGHSAMVMGLGVIAIMVAGGVDHLRIPGGSGGRGLNDGME